MSSALAARATRGIEKIEQLLHRLSVKRLIFLAGHLACSCSMPINGVSFMMG